MRLVGITGKAGSGKDTIANWLAAHRGAVVTHFALPIKQAICGMLSIDMRYFNDRELKERPIPGIGRSPRYLAQTLGTEWGRELVDSDVWVTAMERRLERALADAGDLIVAIPDVRFANEAAMIRARGTLVHVVRRGADGNVGVSGHASEGGVDIADGDVLIENHGSIDELYGKLGALFPFPYLTRGAARRMIERSVSAQQAAA